MLTVIISVAAVIVPWLGAATDRPVPLPQADASPPAKPTLAAPQPEVFTKTVKPYIEKHCVACHKAGKKTAGVQLDQFPTADSVIATAKSKKLWASVLDNIRLGVMPPADKPRPDRNNTDNVIAWIESALSTIDCQLNPIAGRVTMRRLNRTEYNNTIRDLLGLDFKPAESFPGDDVGYGFDNIGDVLSIAPAHIEKYLAAAEEIAARAIVDRETVAAAEFKIRRNDIRTTRRPPPPQDPKRKNLPHPAADKPTEFSFEREFHGGQYTLTLQGTFERIDSTKPGVIAIALNGKAFHEFVINDDLTPKTAPDAKASKDANRPASREPTLQHRGRINTGRCKVTVTVTNLTLRDLLRADRSPQLVTNFDVQFDGPYEADPLPVPESHQRLMALAGSVPNDKPRDQAREILKRLGTRAFRRPITTAEVEKLLKLYDLSAGEKGGSFEAGLRTALMGMLISPHFLFRVELDNRPAPGQTPGKPTLVTEYQLASRLSYFLWCSMPDDELLAQAAAGTLRKNLAAQVKRLLSDPRSRGFVENFATQWLQLSGLEAISPDPKLFVGVDDALKSDMARETLLFFESLVRENRSVLDLLDSDFTFLNERLARHYGIPDVKGNEFRRVKLTGPAAEQRGGLLTQASILTITSNPNRTSPVKRGKWVLEQILGTPPPPPPPGVEELPDDAKGQLSGTLRQRMEQHRANPACASCHARMDPIGFAFENYNAVGIWRTRDGKFDIDPSGTLPDGKSFKGPRDLKAIIKSRTELFGRCLVEKLMTYATGRGMELYDKCAMDQAIKEAAAQQWKFSAVIMAVVNSDPFQKRGGTNPDKDTN